MSIVEREYAENGISRVESIGGRERLRALASPMLDWTRGLDGRHHPDLRPAWVRARGWAAARLVTSAAELVAVFAEESTLAGARMYRVPLAPEALQGLLEPYFYMSGLLFPEDRSFALAKDGGYTLVLAGPPEFVRAAVPDGTEAAWAEYTSYIKGEVLEPGLSQLLRLTQQYRALSAGLA